MKRLTALFLVLAMLCSAFPVFAVAYTGQGGKNVTYSYGDIVNMITDMESLALLPPAGETGAAATSYDRASKYDASTDTYIDWADYEISNYNGSRPYTSNADGWGYIKSVDDERGKGILVADIKGTGAIFRSWFATVGEGNIEIYIDGADQPTICMPLEDFVDSSKETSPYYGLNNLVYTIAEGKNNYTPITFNESCKIILREGWGDYYQFSYRLFAEGVSVEPIGASYTAEQKEALMACNAILGACGTAPHTYEGEQTTKVDHAVPVGERVTLFETTGEGAITRFKVKFNKALGNRIEIAMQKLELSMYWDGEESPSVWAPLGDFFATPGGKSYRSLPLGLEEDGTFYCYWYMPYARSAKIVLENLDEVAHDIHVEVTTAPLKRNIREYARFHTKWSMNRFMPEREDRGSDYTVLKVKGAGRFLGFNLHLYMLTGGYWWGEGDEKFFVDGEKFPSTFGTGSEDYFGYAWGSGAYFTHAFHAQNWINGIFAEDSNINNVRFQLGDNVPFQTEFEACIEKFFDNDNDRYAATAFFYLSADGEDPYTPVKYAEGEEADYRYSFLEPLAAEYGTLLYRNDFERYQNAANDQNTWGNATYAHHELSETRLSAEDSTVAFVVDPLDEKNHALRITQSGSPYTRATLYFGESFATGLSKYGEYTLLGDVYLPQDIGNAKIGPMAFVYSDKSGHHGANKSTVWADTADGTWQRGNVFRFSILNTQDLDLGTAENFNWGADGDNLRYIYFANMDTPTAGKNFYIDNLRLYYTPTVRVGYDLGGLESRFPGLKLYGYPKAGEPLMDLTEAAAKAGYDFKGWSKTPDGKTLLTDYTISQDDILAQDITVYAVMERNAALSYSIVWDKNVLSGINGVATLTASEPTDWTVDTGATDAVISKAESTLTITATGCAGEVKVTGVSKADKTLSQTVTVRLIGGTKWKPGVDVVSGTAKPFTFDGLTKEQIAYGYANNWAAAYGLLNDPLNANNKVMGLLPEVGYKSWVTLHWAHELTTPIEIERPIQVTYDYYGKTTDNWVSVGESVGNAETDIYVNLGGSLNQGVSSWQHYSDTPVLSDKLKEAHKNGITMMAFENGGEVDGTNEYFIDNVSFIPYYRFEFRTFEDELVDVQYALPANGVYAPGRDYLNSIGASGFYLKKDGEMLTQVTLENRDLVLYVKNTPADYGEASIRADSLAALRFRAGLENVQKNGATEYGFLVARQSVLDRLDKDLTFELEKDGAESVYAYGAAYKKDGSIDKVYSYDAETGETVFACAVVGIPHTFYDEKLALRPYIRYDLEGKELTFYGEAAVHSMREAAKAVRASGSTYYTEHKDEIDAIIGEE